MTPRENLRNLVGLIRQAKLGTVGRLALYAAAYVVRRGTGWELYRGGLFSFAFGRFRVIVGRGDLGTIGEIFVNRAYQVQGFIPAEGDTCLDIGANIGCLALQWRLTNRYGRIIAVEPHPTTVEVLRANSALNANAGAAPITIVAAAVGSQDGAVELVVDRDHGSMARTVGEHLRYFDAYEEEDRVTVPCVTIDSLVAAHALAHVDILKIDVEGFEVECLKGAQAALAMTSRVIVEFHGEALRSQCTEILLGHGFSLHARGSLMFAERRMQSA